MVPALVFPFEYTLLESGKTPETPVEKKKEAAIKT
jgi:hypothetical protein